jgi:hypothetical protein
MFGSVLVHDEYRFGSEVIHGKSGRECEERGVDADVGCLIPARKKNEYLTVGKLEMCIWFEGKWALEV